MPPTSRINIKNPEARRLAGELASLTGETLTAAVTTALRERLEIVIAARQKHAEGGRTEASRLRSSSK